MVEGHCAKQYADDARQKCVGKRVVEIIWRADPQNQKNVEGVVLSTATRRGRRLVAVECISKQVFLRFADDAAAPTQRRKRSSSVVDLTADSDDDLICRPKKRARSDEGVVDLTLDSDDEAPATPPRAPGTMLVELRFGIHGKLEVAATAKRTTPDFQFALRLDSGQFLGFASPDAPATISSEAFAKRCAEVGPVDLCGDAFRHGALVDALVATFRAAEGTKRTAKAVVLHQGTGAPGCGNIIANEAPTGVLAFFNLIASTSREIFRVSLVKRSFMPSAGGQEGFGSLVMRRFISSAGGQELFHIVRRRP